MTATVKTVVANYTDEQAAKMSAEYVATPTRVTVEALALSMGKSVRSVVAKLSRMGVYVKPEAVSKTGGKVQKKSELVDALMAKVTLTEAEASSFEHVNKTALVKLIAALTPAVFVENETETE